MSFETIAMRFLNRFLSCGSLLDKEEEDKKSQNSFAKKTSKTTRQSQKTIQHFANTSQIIRPLHSLPSCLCVQFKTCLQPNKMLCCATAVCCKADCGRGRRPTRHDCALALIDKDLGKRSDWYRNAVESVEHNICDLAETPRLIISVRRRRRISSTFKCSRCPPPKLTAA